MRPFPLLALLAACAGGDPAPDGDTDTDTDADSDSDSDTAAAACDPPGASGCGNEASIVRAVVRLGDDVAPAGTRGDLVVALTHQYGGRGESGGVLHFAQRFNDVELAGRTEEVAIDMCSVSSMWSEDACEYMLVVLLDLDDDNDGDRLLPDAGEPAAVVGPFALSCTGSSPCLDVALACTDGASCVQFEDPYERCACADTTCDSDVRACE